MCVEHLLFKTSLYKSYAHCKCGHDHFWVSPVFVHANMYTCVSTCIHMCMCTSMCAPHVCMCVLVCVPVCVCVCVCVCVKVCVQVCVCRSVKQIATLWCVKLPCKFENAYKQSFDWTFVDTRNWQQDKAQNKSVYLFVLEKWFSRQANNVFLYLLMPKPADKDETHHVFVH